MGSPLRMGGGHIGWWLELPVGEGVLKKSQQGKKDNYGEILYKLSCFNPIHLAQHVYVFKVIPTRKRFSKY